MLDLSGTAGTGTAQSATPHSQLSPMDTASVAGSHQNFPQRQRHLPCPASLFYSTLILMFAKEPKSFLVDALADYRKPVLLDREGNAVEYQSLVHRGMYTLKFEKTKLK